LAATWEFDVSSLLRQQASTERKEKITRNLLVRLHLAGENSGFHPNNVSLCDRNIGKLPESTNALKFLHAPGHSMEDLISSYLNRLRFWQA
jgi:hypothetical protein